MALAADTNPPSSPEGESQENQPNRATEKVAGLLACRQIITGEVLPENMRGYVYCRYSLVEVQLEKASFALGSRDLHGHARRH